MDEEEEEGGGQKRWRIPFGRKASVMDIHRYGS